MSHMKVGIVSMGCSKNLVDSERLARRFLDAGIEIDFDSAEGADYAVINTCGFIGDAKEESIEKLWTRSRPKSEVSCAEFM